MKQNKWLKWDWANHWILVNVWNVGCWNDSITRAWRIDSEAFFSGAPGAPRAWRNVQDGLAGKTVALRGEHSSRFSHYLLFFSTSTSYDITVPAFCSELPPTYYRLYTYCLLPLLPLLPPLPTTRYPTGQELPASNSWPLPTTAYE